MQSPVCRQLLYWPNRLVVVVVPAISRLIRCSASAGGRKNMPNAVCDAGEEREVAALRPAPNRCRRCYLDAVLATGVCRCSGPAS